MNSVYYKGRALVAQWIERSVAVREVVGSTPAQGTLITKRRFMNNSHRGFTIIELLIVIGIIAILATLVGLRIGFARESARDATRLSDMQALSQALGSFYTENGRMPNAIDGIPNAGQKLGVGNTIDTVLAPYMRSGIPKDPIDDGVNFYYSYVPSRNVDQCNADPADDYTGTGLAFQQAETDKFVLLRQICSTPGPLLQNQHNADYSLGIRL